jgi:hypothetical protein
VRQNTINFPLKLTAAGSAGPGYFRPPVQTYFDGIINSATIFIQPIGDHGGKMKRLLSFATLLVLLGIVISPSSFARAKSQATGQRFVVFEGFYNPA